MPSIDIKENKILELSSRLLSELLADKTTGKNIMWCTKDYEYLGEEFGEKETIKVRLITGKNGNVIRPRTEKAKDEQQQRAKDKAEVFTPAWIVNTQNNLIDREWFGKPNPFNYEKGKTWKPKNPKEKIAFPKKLGKTWQDYVKENRLEITCGEGPYITTRYDATTGNYIDITKRVGLLDRKLRVVWENTKTEDEFFEWAKIAVQHIYGFEWQGDNVLLARENVLYSVDDAYYFKFNNHLDETRLLDLAKIISWNIWQMDGIKMVVPDSCHIERVLRTQIEFEDNGVEMYDYVECPGCKKNYKYEHNGQYCRVMDWDTHCSMKFIDILKEGK